ncbi:hypothetical protein M1Y64_004345 [Salmonella enterica]|nr:hypothetical protein [Salmonella enterica]
MQNIQKSILNMVMQKWLNSDYLIIDTETTGLDNNAEVIEIAIINMYGDVLLNSLVKPTCSIPAVVTKINNITDEMVADAPLWRDVFPVILNIIDGKKWLAWNSKFDARLIIQTGIITGYFEDLPASKILDIAAKINDSQIDAKAVYDQWYGEFDSKRNNFKRQSLATAAERHNVSVNGAHRALADCMMVLGVLNAVCHSDYAVFEARYAELVADNDKAMEAMKQANEAAEKRIAEQREYYEGVIADGSKRIAELESNEVREVGNKFLVVRHPGKTPAIKHCTGDLEDFLRKLIEQDPLVTIDIITHRYYGVGGQWVQDAGEYLQMTQGAGIKVKGE